MGSETQHHPFQAPAPEKPQFIVPEEHVKGNIRDTIDFGDMKNGQRSDKYNTQGVNLDDEYNAFYRSVEKAEASTEGEGSTVETHGKALEALVAVAEKAENEAKRANERIDAMEKIQLELLNRERAARDNKEAHGGLAEDQPRRVRYQDGVTEKLVKYADGSFGWEITRVDDTATLSKEEGVSALAKPGTEVELYSQNGTVEVTAEAHSDDDTIDVEIVEDDEPESGKDHEPSRQNQEPIDIGELQAIETAPVREAIEAASASQEDETPGAELELMNPEIKELLEQAGVAADRYAGETAKKRNAFLGRFLMGQNMFAAMNRFKEGSALHGILGKLEKASEFLKDKLLLNAGAEKFNDFFDRKLIESRIDFQDKNRAFIDKFIASMSESVNDEERETPEFKMAVMQKKLLLMSNSMNKLDDLICDKRGAISGNPKAKGLTQWWMNRDGLKGKAAKAGVVAGAGFAAGMTAGIVGLGSVGLPLGAGVGVGMGYHVTKRRANAVVDSVPRVDKWGDTVQVGRTLAEKQRDNAKIQRGEFLQGAGEDIAIEDLTRLTEADTAAEIRGNRGRLKGAAVFGGLGGGIGSAVGEALRGAVDASATPTPDQTPEVPKPQTPEVQPPAHEYAGMNFDIQPGSGFSQELMDFASANGHTMSPDQAYELHQQLLGQFGDYIQSPDGSPIGTYLEGGDLRILEPGSGQFSGQVADAIQAYMTAHGI